MLYIKGENSQRNVEKKILKTFAFQKHIDCESFVFEVFADRQIRQQNILAKYFFSIYIENKPFRQ